MCNVSSCSPRTRGTGHDRPRAEYEQELKSWYADSTFWNAIAPYVHFWAQETYADTRKWGVPSSALAERVAYLDDYFLHGLRRRQRE